MPEGLDIADYILAHAKLRGPEKSTCPSEIARKLFPENWRKHMQEVVHAAIELKSQGKVSITQKGKPITTTEIKGPIRIKIV
ncbi:DUF3253 domain-containing protein [Pedobacter aquatilis]|uniref:DUF3253 domain-containing protein n=1 Tax=Pedobacter aquatilis TaxID=351343 RepID=UPI00292E2882|nr:DUF3253 domain-containing protein [Pedobacter aquatilis]